MAYRYSLVSIFLVAACFLSSSLIAGEIQDEELFTIASIQNEEIMLESMENMSNLQAAVGPSQSSNNQLIFIFDASQQTNASGTFRAFVSFPNGNQFCINGLIGLGGVPVTIEVGPPSLLGSHKLTFLITSLEGAINQAQGPLGTAHNLTNGDLIQVKFKVANIGDEDFAMFRNRQK